MACLQQTNEYSIKFMLVLLPPVVWDYHIREIQVQGIGGKFIMKLENLSSFA